MYSHASLCLACILSSLGGCKQLQATAMTTVLQVPQSRELPRISPAAASRQAALSECLMPCPSSHMTHIRSFGSQQVLLLKRSTEEASKAQYVKLSIVRTIGA